LWNNTSKLIFSSISAIIELPDAWRTNEIQQVAMEYINDRNLLSSNRVLFKDIS
jgi:hypothetical protein